MYKRPLTEREKRERAEARERGRQMARESIKKLRPRIKAIANIINEHDERLIRETKETTLKEVGEWLDIEFLLSMLKQGQDMIWQGVGQRMCGEQIKKLEALKEGRMPE